MVRTGSGRQQQKGIIFMKPFSSTVSRLQVGSHGVDHAVNHLVNAMKQA
jgi:hypothetical protein